MIRLLLLLLVLAGGCDKPKDKPENVPQWETAVRYIKPGEHFRISEVTDMENIVELGGFFVFQSEKGEVIVGYYTRTRSLEK